MASRIEKLIQNRLDKFNQRTVNKVKNKLDLSPVFFSLSLGVVRKALEDANVTASRANIKEVQDRFKKAAQSYRGTVYKAEWVRGTSGFLPGVLVFSKEPGRRGTKDALRRIIKNATKPDPKFTSNVTTAIQGFDAAGVTSPQMRSIAELNRSLLELQKRGASPTLNNIIGGIKNKSLADRVLSYRTASSLETWAATEVLAKFGGELKKSGYKNLKASLQVTFPQLSSKQRDFARKLNIDRQTLVSELTEETVEIIAKEVTFYDPLPKEEIAKLVFSSIPGKLVLTGETPKVKKAPKNVKVRAKPPKTRRTKSTSVSGLKLPKAPTTGVNLILLQNLLNQSLFEQIKGNMGSGNSRSVLNYRTGRFAGNPLVTAPDQRPRVLSLQRRGDKTIHAVYTYNTDIYGTFEPGGRQGRPVSRDPKRLIGKSIRELLYEAFRDQFRYTTERTFS